MAFDGGLFVFGGQELPTTVTGPAGLQVAVHYHNDTWHLDCIKWRWRRLPTEGPAPTPRNGQSAVLCGAHMVVFAGSNSQQAFSDVFALDLHTFAWRKVLCAEPDKKEGEPGLAREGHVSWAERREDGTWSLFVVGGRGADGLLDDALELRISGLDTGGQPTGMWRVIGSAPALCYHGVAVFARHIGALPAPARTMHTRASSLD